MDLYAIDYLAVSGRSWLHRLPAGIKLILLALIIAVLLVFQTLPVALAALGAVLLLALSARVRLRTLFPLALYPLIFLLVLFFSVQHLTLLIVLNTVARVLAITMSIVLVLLTTSFPALFGALGRVLPGSLVTALFFTYRAIFILSTSFVNMQTALHLRGGINWRHPRASLRNLGMALAHVLVHAIEMSQRMAEVLTVRGFQNRIYALGRKTQ